MLSDTGSFVSLPGEQRLFSSPPRTSVTLQTLNKYPGHEPFSLSTGAGQLHLTNRRVRSATPCKLDKATSSYQAYLYHPVQIVYVPSPVPTTASPTTLQSFAAPLTHLHDSRVTAPWVGPNVWIALVQPVINGGIPSHIPAVEARFTFKDGGAYDWHTKFCQVKERLAQVMENRGLSGATMAAGAPEAMEGVNLDQLPAYEEMGTSVPYTEPPVGRGVSQGVMALPAELPSESPPPLVDVSVNRPSVVTTSTPAEPPPGYDEVQRNSISEHLDRDQRPREGTASDA